MKCASCGRIVIHGFEYNQHDDEILCIECSEEESELIEYKRWGDEPCED